MKTLMGTISWNGIKVEPTSKEAFPVESQASRYYAARSTDASPLTVSGQHEKFLFYRGAARFPVPLAARVNAEGKIAVNNVTSDTVPSVILFENRGGHIGYRNAGALKDEVKFDSLPLNGSIAGLRRELEVTLVAQGLYPKEAHAMIETWQDSWFEEGSRVIYIVPSAAINSVLPLQVSPAPAQTARVFVGRIELLTPATVEAVQDAITKNDQAAAERYARFLGPIIARISASDRTKVPQINSFLSSLPSKAQGCK
jgi:hypothetical protein